MERIRRSVAMLPPGHSAAALTREAAMELIHEVATARSETANTAKPSPNCVESSRRSTPKEGPPESHLGRTGFSPFRPRS
jgi:hypothetical protein